MKYIESFREGDRVNDVYLCKFKQAALTKTGKPYDNVVLQDKTGTIDAKIWDPGSVGIDEFEVMDGDIDLSEIEKIEFWFHDGGQIALDNIGITPV